MYRISTGAVLIGLALAACTGDTPDYDEAVEERSEDLTPQEELAVAGDTSVGFETGRSAPLVPVQGGATAGGALTATGELRSLREGFPAGTVTLTEEERGTRVTIRISRMPQGTEARAVVTRGSCEESGRLVAAAPDVISVGDQGVATFDETLDVPTSQIFDGTHSIRLVNPEATGDAPEMTFACAELGEG